jgi:hypothetical protein
MSERLSNEHYKLYPLADPNCKICRMKIEDIKKLHHMKFQEGLSYEKINDHLNLYFNESSMSTLVAHFTKHTSEGTKLKLAKTLDLTVANELEKLSLDQNEANADNLQTAYSYLTKTSMDLAESSSKILGPFLKHLKELPEEKVQEKLEKMSPLKALEQMARIQKLISDHVQTISQMRAPKVVVAQFLDLAVNEVIRQTGYIFAEMCKTIEIEVCADLKEQGANIGTIAFKKAFSKSAIDFRNAMTNLKRDQLTRAIEVLSEIEKIV